MTSGSGISRSMRRARIFLRMVICGILLSGCVNSTLTPSPTPADDRPTPTHTPTFAIPTIVPSETLTPSPVPSGTPDPEAGLGEAILLDDFSENLGWELSEDGTGATSIHQGRMIISLHEPKRLRYVLAPAQPLIDFYLEVEVRPEICQPDDEFGVLFRVNAQLEYYRFAINCDGQMRMSRILQNDSRALTPLSITPSISPGPKANTKLAIRAYGDQFRMWINGIEALTLRDVSLQSGLVGFFVRTGRGNQATVSFDNLLLRETLSAQPPTATGEST